MKNITGPTTGKILLHDEGLGEATAEAIVARAREIALIAGRDVPTREDHAQARAELGGALLPPTSAEDASTMDSLSRDPSDPPAHHGKQTPNYEGLDEEITPERLVTEGVEEAQHDQMLAARRRPPV